MQVADFILHLIFSRMFNKKKRVSLASRRPVSFSWIMGLKYQTADILTVKMVPWALWGAATNAAEVDSLKAELLASKAEISRLTLELSQSEPARKVLLVCQAREVDELKESLQV